MSTIATKLITAQEFFEWIQRPENRDKECELVRGEIVEMTKPGKRHGLVCSNIDRILGNFAQQRKKGYPCANDTGLVVDRDPDTVRGPDIVFFEDAISYDEVEKGFGEKPPLLAVEVLSPTDTAGKMNQRILDQLDFGTALVWVVDPEARNVTVFRPGKQPYRVSGDQELTGDDALPDFRCKVAEFFALPGQS
jgi:Uma2 family endonuclease